MFCLRVVRKKYVYIYIEYGIYVYKYPLSILKNRDTLVCFGILLVLFFFFVGRWWEFADGKTPCVWEGDAGIMPFVGLGRSGTDPPPMSEGWRRKMISKLSTRCDLCDFLVFDRFDLLIWCVSRIPSRLLILWLQEHVLNNWWTPATSSIYTL